MERIKLPTEADTPPQNLSVKQTMNMIRFMLKDCLNMDTSIYAEEDGVIQVDGQFKLWNNGVHWQCFTNREGEWSPCYPIGADNPMDFFPRIIQCMARKKLDVWIMTNYCCMA